MKRSKYATLDRVIVEVIREREKYGANHSTLCVDGRVAAFARKYGGAPGGRFISRTVSRRLAAMRENGRIVSNGVSGDGCRWYAVP